ncbi:MAG TPA: MFS transporter [Microscillaceae bacterium]|jgi:MFS family permease|nr:MFS transporter [Microscillaceae bacterium]
MQATSTSTKLWTKDFLLLTLSNLFMASGSFFLIPTLPIYAEKVLQSSKTDIGLILGLYTLSALLMRPLAGWALDIVGRKWVYLCGMVIFVILMPFYLWATTMATLLLLRFLHGIAWGVITTGGSTIVSDIVPAARRGEGIGYFGMSFTISMALGPVLGLWMIAAWDFSTIIWASSAVSLVTLLIALTIHYPVHTASIQHKQTSWDQFIDKRGIPTATLALICSAVYGGLVTFITLFTQEKKIAAIQWGDFTLPSSAVFFMLYALGLTLIRPIAGTWLDRHGPKQVLGYGFVVLIVGLTSLASIHTLGGLMVASAITGVGMGTILPTTLTMVVNLVEPEKRGVANSTFFSAVDIGVGLGSILLGKLADIVSIATMFYFCALVIFIPLALFFLLVLPDYQKKLTQVNA